MKKKTAPVRKKSIEVEKNATNERQHSVEEMNNLIHSILLDTKDTEQELSVRMGYAEGYITQTRSRKQVTDRLIFRLEEELKRKTAKSKPDVTVNEAYFIRAAVTHILDELALLKARVHGRQPADVLDEFEQNIALISTKLLKG